MVSVVDLVAGERAGVDVDHDDAGVGDELLHVGDVADADHLGADAAGVERRDERLGLAR